MLAMTGNPEQFIQKKERGKGIHQLLGPPGQRFIQCALAPLSFQVDSGWFPVRFFLFQCSLRWEQRRQNRGVRSGLLCFLQGISCIFSRRSR